MITHGLKNNGWRWAAVLLCCAPAAVAQVDPQRAAGYFKEAAALCERENGKLWGVSLCGPMVIADAATHTIATSQPAPDAKQPAMLGFANSATEWGGTRWSTLVWQMLPADAHARGRLMMHELFHRVQPQLGFQIRDGQLDHLDTVDGRYWMQLEWRALAKALGATGPARTAALRDALAFRAARRKVFSNAAENERLLEMNEGLAQYTGTVAAAATAADATADAIQQLAAAATSASFIRTFAYPSGAAYGLLLDEYSPGWTHRVKYADDFGQLVMTAAHVLPGEDPDAAAKQYGGPGLKLSEMKMDAERQALLAELRRRFVQGPVLVIPSARSASFTTAGMTPLPGEGTIYPTYRTTGEWGTLQGAQVLVSADRSLLTVPAPASVEGTSLKGDGWTLELAAGWTVRPGERAGDFKVAKNE